MNRISIAVTCVLAMCCGQWLVAQDSPPTVKQLDLPFVSDVELVGEETPTTSAKSGEACEKCCEKSCKKSCESHCELAKVTFQGQATAEANTVKKTCEGGCEACPLATVGGWQLPIIAKFPFVSDSPRAQIGVDFDFVRTSGECQACQDKACDATNGVFEIIQWFGNPSSTKCEVEANAVCDIEASTVSPYHSANTCVGACAANTCTANTCAANTCAANTCAANTCAANTCAANTCAANTCAANTCQECKTATVGVCASTCASTCPSACASACTQECDGCDVKANASACPLQTAANSKCPFATHAKLFQQQVTSDGLCPVVQAFTAACPEGKCQCGVACQCGSTQQVAKLKRRLHKAEVAMMVQEALAEVRHEASQRERELERELAQSHARLESQREIIELHAAQQRQQQQWLAVLAARSNAENHVATGQVARQQIEQLTAQNARLQKVVEELQRHIQQANRTNSPYSQPYPQR